MPVNTALAVEGPDATYREPYRPASLLAPCLVTAVLVLGVKVPKVQEKGRARSQLLQSLSRPVGGEAIYSTD